jgi:16S rRNA (adenine1518-N6/adenine1519-N6)-dimethyltransferase
MYTLKKSLGQHFLHDEGICKNIVEALLKNKVHNVVEIGPGAGAITKYLLQAGNIHFKAIEIDTEKHDYLLKTYPAIKDKILNIDFLKADKPFGEEPFWVIGNFPYNISTEILFKIISWKEQVHGVIGMFQKEVAERIASKEGSKVYGVTSILTQAFYKVQYLFDVPPTCFNPPPKVMSGVIEMQLLPEGIIPADKEKRLFTVVKTAFQQRRKTLRNSVKGIFTNEQLQDDIFNLRPEQLTVQQFIALSCL